MKDKLRSTFDIGQAVRELRKSSGTRTTTIAEKSGLSRDVLNRLERGKDVSLSSLLAILHVMGYGIDIVRIGPPTLDEMEQRIRVLVEEDDAP